MPRFAVTPGKIPKAAKKVLCEVGPWRPQRNQVQTQALYDSLIATLPEIERKGDASPYTSLNGNMFTLLHQSKLAIRLPEVAREAFQRKYKTTLFEAYGTMMKEYVAVPMSCWRTRKN